MTWIERALRAFDQENEQDQRLRARYQQEREKERKKAAKDITGLIKGVTGERMRVDRLVELATSPTDGTVYGVVNLDGVEFGIHYYNTGNNYYTHHKDLLVLQRDRESGLWTYQVANTQADLGRVLQDMRVSSPPRTVGYGIVGVTGGPGGPSRDRR